MKKEIQGILDVPLQIDSSNPENKKKAVRIYKWKAYNKFLLTGIGLPWRVYFPIAKKYMVQM